MGQGNKLFEGDKSQIFAGVIGNGTLRKFVGSCNIQEKFLV
jgi:hypothetical protein